MEQSKGISKFLIITLVVLLIVILTGGAVYYFQNKQNTDTKTDLQAQIDTLNTQLQSAKKSASTPTPTASTSSMATPTASPSVSPIASADSIVSECLPANLSASLVASGGAAGTYFFNLSLTNKGKIACTVSGAPTISALSSTGSEVGKTTQVATSTTKITVDPNSKVYSQIGFPNSGNFSTGVCQPMKSLVVILSDETTGVTIPNIDTYNSTFTSSYCQALNVSNFTSTVQ